MDMHLCTNCRVDRGKEPRVQCRSASLDLLWVVATTQLEAASLGYPSLGIHGG